MYKQFTSYEWSKKIKLFSKIGEPFVFQDEEKAKEVKKMLNNRFRRSKNIIWRIS